MIGGVCQIHLHREAGTMRIDIMANSIGGPGLEANQKPAIDLRALYLILNR